MLRIERTLTLTLTCFFPSLDYVGAILGLVRDQSDWRLDPLQTIRELNHEFAPVGEGNVVSIEFNMLYRWHATLSQSNEKWFKEEVFEEVFPGKASHDVCTHKYNVVWHMLMCVSLTGYSKGFHGRGAQQSNA